MHKMFWQLFLACLLITLVSLLAVALYESRELRDFYHRRTDADLQSRARLLESRVMQLLTSSEPADVDALCKQLGERSSTRITVVLPDGKVLGDTEGTPSKMDNHAGRPEIAAALDGRIRPSVRISPTLGLEMMYVAIPVRREGTIIGILRTSIPVADIDQALSAIRSRIILGSVVVAFVAAGISLLISRRISHPLEQLRQGAEQFAQGDLSGRLHVGKSEEVASLAETLNRMAAELDRRIRSTVRERNQREAILSSMVEGVLAVDSRQHLVNLNQAAARLLGVDAETVLGRTLQEVVRSAPLQSLLGEVLSGGQPAEDDLVLKEGAEERLLHVSATVLHDVGGGDAAGPEMGVLLAIHDVTRLRQLENTRRDFVANVSHELKTPITSIKGFVETLLDGAMHEPDDAQRFLRIVAAQADRLGEIIEDLLTLSWLERDTDQASISLQPGRIRDVMHAALGVCQRKASERNVRVELTCDDQLHAPVNAALLEQAVVNLVDNAIKYSPEGNSVRLEATRSESEVVIRVCDQGAGIEPEHLPRLFERFYRVDKARSRELGGTGLGLAIVKHIAQAHGGWATVESTPGEGSTFSLHLPL